MSRRITLPIHIDGKGPFNFVVDTGSERTVISRELASKLALAPDDPVRINSMAGITQVNTVTIPRLSYGHGMMPSVQAPVLEAIRSDERRVGKECVSTCRSRWSPYH